MTNRSIEEVDHFARFGKPMPNHRRCATIIEKKPEKKPEEVRYR
jgi:hypothetical protein